MTSYDDDDNYDDDDDDYDYDRRPILKIVGGVAAVALLAIGGFFLLRDSSDDQSIREASDTSSSSAPTAREAGTNPSTADPTAASTESVVTSETAPDTDEADSDADNLSSTPTVTGAPTTTTAEREAVPPTTAPETTTSEPSTASTANAPTTEPAQTPSYPVLPDGTPQPIVAIYDTDSITLTGVAPSIEAQVRLEQLAVANSNFPEATLISLITIDPTIPIGVGVRVIELNSARFPAGSAEILPDHAVQLDRAAGILNLLENVTVTVIGHADQRGDPETNFQLSLARAVSVTNYLASTGVSPDRLAARAVGEDDLLSVSDEDAALALNRRTEFTFYGLLIE